MHQNVQSLSNSINIIEDTIKDLEVLNALCLTEHWRDKQQLSNHGIQDFILASSFCRSLNKHGGSAIYLRRGTAYQERQDIVKMSIEKVMEISSVEIRTHSGNIILLSIYSPPNETRLFLKKIEEVLDMISWTKNTVIIAGDFNINILDKENRNTKDFLELLNSYGIIPTIEVPTRTTSTSSTCIDNIATNHKNYTAKTIRTNISDHDTAQILTIKHQIEDTNKYKYKRIMTPHSIQELKERLEQVDWEILKDIPEQEVDQQWATFSNIFKLEMDFSCPMKKSVLKTTKKSKPKSEKLRNCKSRLDILHTCKIYNPAFQEPYKEAKREYDLIIQEEKRQNYRKQILESDNKTKALWNTVKKIKGSTHQNTDITGNPKEMANEFNSYFSSITTNKTNCKKNLEPHCKIPGATSNLKLRSISEEETMKIISMLKNKNSCGTDGIPMKLAKECTRQIAGPLTYLINTSMKNGIFPEIFKTALIKPIYKKGELNKPESYRPISILPTFSKILEMAICMQLTSYLIEEDILTSCQHGYLKGKSTQTAVFEFITEVLSALEDSQIMITLMLDLSKAFDSLSHDLIFDKLQSYGIKGTELNWFRSYLTNRRHRVVIFQNNEETLSDVAPTELGVPQGSILGPILFIIFLNDLSMITDSKPYIKMINYADDTDLSIKADTFPETANLVKTTLAQASEWFKDNNLQMNTEKTKAILFKTTHAGFQTPTNIQMTNSTVHLQKSGHFLGLHIDESLNWNEHISELRTNLSSICYTLGVLRKHLDSTSLKTIYQAVFESKMRYGILFYGSSSNMTAILKMQKRAIRVMFGMRRIESCRGIFRENGLLTAPAIHIQECLLFVFKNRHYFKEKTASQYETRTTTLKYPKHRLTLTEKGPEYRCIRYYNKIANYIREESSLKHLKKLVYKLLLKIEPYTIEEFLNYAI